MNAVEYKGYNIKGDGTFGMKVIHTIKPGSVPKELRGSFSNTGTAQKSIDSFLRTKKVVKDGKASSTS